MYLKKKAIHIALLLPTLRTDIIKDGSQIAANIPIKSVCELIKGYVFFPIDHHPLVGQRLLIVESSRFTLIHTTFSKTPLHERSARPRDHNT